MTEREKLSLLEEIMELDEGELSLDTVLADYDEWDSVAAISYIALMDEKFNKAVRGAQIREFKTAADAIALME